MGCWNETCMLTHLPILEGEDTICVLIAQQPGDKDTIHSDAIYAPISLPLFGKYDDYGRLENFTDFHEFLSSLWYTELVKVDEGSGADSAFTPMKPLNDCRDNELTDFLDLVRQGSVYIRDEEAASGYSRVYLAFIKKPFFENAVKVRKRYFMDDFVNNISFRIRLSPSLKIAIQENLVGCGSWRPSTTSWTFPVSPGIRRVGPEVRIAWTMTTNTSFIRTWLRRLLAYIICTMNSATNKKHKKPI